MPPKAAFYICLIFYLIFFDTGKNMKKYVESIKKAVRRRQGSAHTEIQITYEKPLPRILWHITGPEQYDKFDLMTVR